MTSAPQGAFRADIQALRGYAVLVVILYHAGLGLVPGGYLGVDIFFVVSGFLIGGHVIRSLDEGAFRFAAFYLRRVRRLAPAACAVLLATILAAWFVLTGAAFERFAAQALGSLVYSTNVVLWQQINYFNNSAASEPLLHMWSLAIEEQFYLLLPVLLWMLPRRWRLAAVLVATLGSLAAYLALYPRSPGAAFYLLPTRAWELGLGVCIAMLLASGRAPQLAAVLVWPGLALILLPVLFTWPLPQHLLAVPACAGTALLLLHERSGGPWLAPLVRVGDASYSLYLVHWPLFAFATVLWLGAEPPLIIRLGLIGLTGLLGWGLYRFVEGPGRWHPASPRRVVGTYLAVTAILAGLVALASWQKRAESSPVDLSGVTGLALPGCDATATRYSGACATSSEPELLVWGDSFSQHLIPALQVSGNPALAQASKGQCAPLLGLAPVDRDATATFAAGCLAFNESVIEYLRTQPSIRVVVLSGYYQRYAQPGTVALQAGGRIGAVKIDDLIAAQQRTTAAIRALGKRVVVVSGPPQARFDVGQCWARMLGHLPMFPPADRCRITAAGASPATGWSAALFDGLASRGQTPVIRMDRWLCPAGTDCETMRSGVPLYRDANHLGHDGSRQVGREFNLAARVQAAAR
jgi:peptidoglycan/LPS O-acetylase OafA/YrhL